MMADNDGACVPATDKSTVNVGRQTKKHCSAMLFPLTADIDGTCVQATDNDGRQTMLFLIKSGHGLLLIYFFFIMT